MAVDLTPLQAQDFVKLRIIDGREHVRKPRLWAWQIPERATADVFFTHGPLGWIKRQRGCCRAPGSAPHRWIASLSAFMAI
jgi:hypothetical protein